MNLHLSIIRASSLEVLQDAYQMKVIMVEIICANLCDSYAPLSCMTREVPNAFSLSMTFPYK